MYHFNKAISESPRLQAEEANKLQGARFHLSMSEEELLLFALGSPYLPFPTLMVRISCSFSCSCSCSFTPSPFSDAAPFLLLHRTQFTVNSTKEPPCLEDVVIHLTPLPSLWYDFRAPFCQFLLLHPFHILAMIKRIYLKNWHQAMFCPDFHENWIYTSCLVIT